MNKQIFQKAFLILLFFGRTDVVLDSRIMKMSGEFVIGGLHVADVLLGDKILNNNRLKYKKSLASLINEYGIILPL